MILARLGDLVISGINATKEPLLFTRKQQQNPIAQTPFTMALTFPIKNELDIQYLWWFLRSDSFREIVQHQHPRREN